LGLFMRPGACFLHILPVDGNEAIKGVKSGWDLGTNLLILKGCPGPAAHREPGRQPWRKGELDVRQNHTDSQLSTDRS